MCLAIPGQIEQIYEENDMRMGKVNFGGVVKDVCLACLQEVAVGEYSLVHVVFANSRIDDAAAPATLKTFAELGMLVDELTR